VLTELDELLCHQVAAPFGEVATSDHRFYDRNWFCSHHPTGELAFITGMGCYPNMNVLDGYVAVQHAGVQYNLRLSRQLRPAIGDLHIGPLRQEVVSPLHAIRLVLDPSDNYPVAFDLLWEGFLAAHEEAQHHTERNGRTVEDTRRYKQLGRVRGWLELHGQRSVADGWFGIRDHSWGVRPGVGGFEPVTSASGAAGPTGLGSGDLALWLDFADDQMGGNLILVEDAEGRRIRLDGAVRWPDEVGRPAARVVDVAHDLSFFSGTQAFRHGRVVVRTDDGGEWTMDAWPVVTAWAYSGTGYDGGFRDGLGLGAYRGELCVEVDDYDLSDPEQVILDGMSVPAGHREQPVRLELNGRPGHGKWTVLLSGRQGRRDDRSG
jgi:hypothetical protein